MRGGRSQLARLTDILNVNFFQEALFEQRRDLVNEVAPEVQLDRGVRMMRLIDAGADGERNDVAGQQYLGIVFREVPADITAQQAGDDVRSGAAADHLGPANRSVKSAISRSRDGRVG